MLSLEVMTAFDSEAKALLKFAEKARVESGFGWLTNEGNVDQEKGTHLWITGRMTHVFALGYALGYEEYLPLVEHGVVSLLEGKLRDNVGSGWHSAVDLAGQPLSSTKVSYDHTFVILGAASALAVGAKKAQELLDTALKEFIDLWWDDSQQMVVDSRDASGMIDSYRGINTNMHTVEAFLAAFGGTKDLDLLKKAVAIVQRVVRYVDEFNYRLPEHFTPDWKALVEYNRDVPADAFRPFGSTIGHWLEWSRLILELMEECRKARVPYHPHCEDVPEILYRRSLLEGWGTNGEPGFVYTVDFDGAPVVSQRMYWVLCEAIGAAASLAQAHNNETYWNDVEFYWEYAKKYLIESSGRWHQELNQHNVPDPSTWVGRPDVYHALQAMIVSKCPLAPSFAWSLSNK